MSKTKEETKEETKSEEVNLYEIFDNFKDSKDEDIRLFQLIRSGQSWGAKIKNGKEICAKVSIAIPYDICNPNNTNLGEMRNYYGFVLLVPKEKVNKFLEE